MANGNGNGNGIVSKVKPIGPIVFGRQAEEIRRSIRKMADEALRLADELRVPPGFFGSGKMHFVREHKMMNDAVSRLREIVMRLKAGEPVPPGEISKAFADYQEARALATAPDVSPGPRQLPYQEKVPILNQLNKLLLDLSVLVRQLKQIEATDDTVLMEQIMREAERLLGAQQQIAIQMEKFQQVQDALGQLEQMVKGTTSKVSQVQEQVQTQLQDKVQQQVEPLKQQIQQNRELVQQIQQQLTSQAQLQQQQTQILKQLSQAIVQAKQAGNEQAQQQAQALTQQLAQIQELLSQKDQEIQQLKEELQRGQRQLKQAAQAQGLAVAGGLPQGVDSKVLLLGGGALSLALILKLLRRPLNS